uniref:Alpha amylase Alstotide S4 n=2 Tax=Alstonia scholaris TaxID=52822 RepID=A0A0S0ZR47_ALSSC|nr:alpha amylase precursor Alstotide S4 [Alstonia scholaris]
MAKLACFLLLLLILSAVFEVHAVAEEELPKIEMSRQMLPKASIITTIIPFMESDEKLGCVPQYGVCDGIINQCCDPYYCSPPIYGHCI